METGTNLSQVGYGFFAPIVNDSFLVTDDKGRFYCWCRRRPEGSWSPLNFPAAWTTGTLVLACVVNVFGYSDDATAMGVRTRRMNHLHQRSQVYQSAKHD